jgi:hypothetical protein
LAAISGDAQYMDWKINTRNRRFRPRALRFGNLPRHSGAMRSIEPGISRFPDAQLRI